MSKTQQPSTHRCPAPNCTKMHVKSSMLMCRTHWYQVPEPIRSEVWRSYQSGNSEAHTRAIKAAIKSLMPEVKP